MAGETVRVKGYKEFLRACDHAGRDTKREVRATFRKVGEVVRADAQQRMDRYSPVSAAGYRVRVRQRGVAVEQSLRKTTGKRPDWGSTQMRKGLLPAMREKQGEVVAEFDHAMDLVADHFDNL